jgi:replicative DNA helicase
VSRLEPQTGFSLGRASEITRDELKFMMFIDKLRSKFTLMFDELMERQLALKGICSVDEWKELKQKIHYDFLKDNNFAELKNAELLTARLDIMQRIDPYVGVYFSKDYIRKKVLNLDEEEINEIIAITKDDESFLSSKIEQLIEERKARETIPIRTSDIKAVFKDYLQSDSKPENLPIKTGWRNVDASIEGFRPGEFIVFGGRPGMGKTVVLIDLIKRISLRDPVLLISLELTAVQISNRIISSVLDYELPIKGPEDLRSIDKEKLDFLAEYLEAMQLSICETTFDSMFALKSYCEKMVNEKGIRVIAIDYLQMLSSNRYRHNRELEVSYISRTLKKIAKDLNICMIVTSQLSRSVETRGGDKRPLLSDLRESGAIEQDADKVIFVYRPDYYGITTDEDGNTTKGQLELLMVKNRTGAIDRFNFHLTFPSLKLEPMRDINTPFVFERKPFVEPNETDSPF